MLIIGLSEAARARAEAACRHERLSWPGCAAVLRLPFPRAAPRFLARLHARPTWEVHLSHWLQSERATRITARPGGLIAAFLLTLVVLLADVTIGIYGSRAQQVPGSDMAFMTGCTHKLVLP